MSWTTLLAIMCVPVAAYAIRVYLAEPIERIAKEHLPEKWARLLTKEHGDKRNAPKR